jgi:hypothetical protein
LARGIDESRLAAGSNLNDPLSIFLNSLRAHIAIMLRIMEDEDERRDDGNKDQQNKAHTKSVPRG